MGSDAYSSMLRYRELAHAAEPPGGWGTPLSFDELPDRQVLHALWATGMFDRIAEDGGGLVRVLDPGVWNRGAGPDFEGARIDIDGDTQCGAVALTCRADDPLPTVDSGGHAAVALHVSVCPPQGIRTSCDAMGAEPPLLTLPAERVRRILDLPPRVRFSADEAVLRPLETMPFDAAVALLRAAAAYRLRRKHRRFLARKNVVGAGQAWYEAWAETLGYSANKLPMRLLAARVPLSEAQENPEALLFGSAGFLSPTLPERAAQEARTCHAGIWRSWWSLRDRYELMGERALQWSFSGQRPQNHPHRRVAALAALVSAREEIEPLLKPDRLDALFCRLESLQHPYWSFHASLPSARGSRKTALIGRERAVDFAVNHVLPNDGSEMAWNILMQLRGSTPASAVVKAAASLWGDRPDLLPLLRLAYVQQGLLQLRDDFGAPGPNGSLLFSPLLAAWKGIA